MPSVIFKIELGNVLSLLAAQFVLFGWRIQREIHVGDEGRRVWFPVPDILNVLSMFLVLVFCLILPLSSGPSQIAQVVSVKMIFVGALVLLAFHPLAMVAHYGLLNKTGREVRESKADGKKDFAYCPIQERLVIGAALIRALIAAKFAAG